VDLYLTVETMAEKFMTFKQVNLMLCVVCLLLQFAVYVYCYGKENVCVDHGEEISSNQSQCPVLVSGGTLWSGSQGLLVGWLHVTKPLLEIIF